MEISKENKLTLILFNEEVEFFVNILDKIIPKTGFIKESLDSKELSYIKDLHSSISNYNNFIKEQNG